VIASRIPTTQGIADMNIYISGTLAYDRIMDFPGRFADHILPEKIHLLNVCFMVNGLVERFGGTAGNIAYNLVLLGEKPLIIATAGRDFGPYRDWLVRLGLPLTGVRLIDQELTAAAFIITDLDNNQITGFNAGATRHGANFRLEASQLGNILAIVATGNFDDMLSLTRFYKNRGISYLFDPGQGIPAWSGSDLKEMIQGSRCFIGNDYEIELVCRKTGLDETGLLGITDTLIITKGAEGSLLITADGAITIPAAPAHQVLDPTGAGDAYRAGLAKGWLQGWPWKEAAALGTVMASFAVEQQGTQEHRPTLQEIRRRYEENFGGTLKAARL